MGKKINSEALNAYNEGLGYYFKHSTENLKKALECFIRARSMGYPLKDIDKVINTCAGRIPDPDGFNLLLELKAKYPIK